MLPEYILVVDDQRGIRVLLDQALQALGYCVKTVASGPECLSCAFSQNCPKLIILDQSMPVMTGLQVLSRLVENDKTRHIPVIMISAELGMEETALSSGADCFLKKPLDMVDLCHVVEELLTASQT